MRILSAVVGLGLLCSLAAHSGAQGPEPAEFDAFPFLVETDSAESESLLPETSGTESAVTETAVTEFSAADSAAEESSADAVIATPEPATSQQNREFHAPLEPGWTEVPLPERRSTRIAAPDLRRTVSTERLIHERAARQAEARIRRLETRNAFGISTQRPTVYSDGYFNNPNASLWRRWTWQNPPYRQW